MLNVRPEIEGVVGKLNAKTFFPSHKNVPTKPRSYVTPDHLVSDLPMYRQ